MALFEVFIGNYSNHTLAYLASYATSHVRNLKIDNITNMTPLDYMKVSFRLATKFTAPTHKPIDGVTIILIDPNTFNGEYYEYALMLVISRLNKPVVGPHGSTEYIEAVLMALNGQAIPQNVDEELDIDSLINESPYALVPIPLLYHEDDLSGPSADGYVYVINDSSLSHDSESENILASVGRLLAEKNYLASYASRNPDFDMRTMLDVYSQIATTALDYSLAPLDDTPENLVQVNEAEFKPKRQITGTIETRNNPNDEPEPAEITTVSIETNEISGTMSETLTIETGITLEVTVNINAISTSVTAGASFTITSEKSRSFTQSSSKTVSFEVNQTVTIPPKSFLYIQPYSDRAGFSGGQDIGISVRLRTTELLPENLQVVLRGITQSALLGNSVPVFRNAVNVTGAIGYRNGVNTWTVPMAVLDELQIAAAD